MDTQEIHIITQETYANARKRAQALQDHFIEAFPEIDPFYGYARGRFVKVSVELDENPDGSIRSLEYIIKVDFFKTTLQEFLKIASVIEKQFPEYKID